MIFDKWKVVTSDWRSAKQRRISQSYWITWPKRLWLLWGIVLWKEILCKTWIVFILMKCVCFIIKINHVWSRVKTLLKNALFSKKTHCFPTCALFYPIVLKRKIITGFLLIVTISSHSLGTVLINLRDLSMSDFIMC